MNSAIIETIRFRLSSGPAHPVLSDHRTPTSVALIFRQGGESIDLLFIERAADERDPWSGNIGFPGGRRSGSDRDLRHTAERETLEEVGIDLDGAEYLGRLADIVGSNLPVRVACFVYQVPPETALSLNPEVGDAFWVPFDVLAEPERHIHAEVSFGGRPLQSPAIVLPYPGKPVLWGITYRLFCQFKAIATRDEPFNHPNSTEEVL